MSFHLYHSWFLWAKWKFFTHFQNFSPGLRQFTYQCMFITAETPVNPNQSRQGIERKQPFSPPLYSWYMELVWHVPITKDLPIKFLLEGAGREERARAVAGRDRWSRDWLANSSKLGAIKPLSPNLSFPLSSFGFPGFIGNLSQEGNPFNSQSYTNSIPLLELTGSNTLTFN